MKKLIVLGGGESGVGAAILAKRSGYDVFLSDGGRIKERYQEELANHEIEYEQGGHDEQRIVDADEVMKSPGIPHKTPIVQKLMDKGVPVISEMELAYRHKGRSRIIGITGSNGKTTTTALTYHICKEGGADCALVGNIGNSIARQVALDPKELYVVEISSFQLDDIQSFRPDVAVLTNITEDHLDRYAYQFESYIRSKFNIMKYQNQHDYFIYNEDDPVTMQYLNTYPLHSNPLPLTMNRQIPNGAFINKNIMSLQTGEKLTMSVFDFALRGRHNQYNTMAACVAASTVGIRKEKIRDAVKTFESLEHRMEPVGVVRGVEFINDSKATNVNSTWFALESMNRPVVLILGGVDKGNDYTLLQELVQEKVKAIVCLGTDNARIHDAFRAFVPVLIDADNAAGAVQAAFQHATKGDVVLLSPACASFDLFANYEDRGRQFREAVREL